MPTLDDDHTGTRIREQRKLARLTQRQLADRIPYSYALLNSVECGLRRRGGAGPEDRRHHAHGTALRD
jgi:transcriptional regulator with XRE-family HTH domain